MYGYHREKLLVDHFWKLKGLDDGSKCYWINIDYVAYDVNLMKSVPRNNNIIYYDYCLLFIILALFFSQLNSKNTSKKYRITDFKMLKCHRETTTYLTKNIFMMHFYIFRKS